MTDQADLPREENLRVDLGIDPIDNTPIILLALGDQYVELPPEGARQVATGLNYTATVAEEFRQTIQGLSDEEIQAEIKVLAGKLQS